MYVARFTSFEQLAPLRSAWTELAAGIPFRDWPWLESWWAAYGESCAGASRELCVVAVTTEEDELVGLAPWYIERSRSRGAVLRFLGSGEVCSDYLSVLARPHHQIEVAAALANWLAPQAAGGTTAEAPQTWDLLDLGLVPHHDATIERLSQELRVRGASVYKRPSVSCWRLALPPSWENYLGQLSKSHRKQIRQLDKRYFKSGAATFHEVTSAAQLDAGLEILENLHQRRRQSLGEKGCFRSATFTAFINRASATLLARGELRLCWVEIGGRPAAVEYQLLSKNAVFAYQAGVDPEQLEHEPGRLITIATLKRTIAEGRQVMDFLRGDEPYKAHWRAEPTPTQELRVIAPTSSARLRHRAWVAGSHVKRLVRSSLQASSGPHS